MRIIFLEAVQNLGGARRSTIELAKRLEESGHDVLLVDFWGCCKPFVELAGDFGLPLKILDKRDNPIIISSSNKVSLFTNRLNYFFYNFKLRRRFRQIISEFKPNLISLNNVKCLSIVAKGLDLDIHFIARGWFNYNSISFTSKYILNQFKNIKYFAVSQATRQAIYSGGFARLENIFILADVIDFRAIKNISDKGDFPSWENAVDRPFVLHHCGGFLETKGQHISIEVAKKLKEENINFKLIFTGIIYKGGESDFYYNRLVNLVYEFGLQSHIEFVIDSRDVLRYFYNSDLLILPSYTEGLPRVILESMAFGKPVVANPVGGVIDVVINGVTGRVVDFNDVDDYYLFILDLLRNKDTYRYLSRNCLNMIRNNFTSQNQIESIEKYYS